MSITAHPIDRQRHVSNGGLESKLDIAAVLILVFGFCVAAITLFAAGFLPAGWLAAAWTVFSSWLAWLMLRAIAEIIRLLKKIAQHPFEGNISGARIDHIQCCSNCGHILYGTTRCEGCGAEIIEVAEISKP